MAADSLGVLDALQTVPEQLAAAHEAAAMATENLKLPDPSDFDNVVIMGMGGSGIVGDVVQAVGTGTLPIPVVVLKYYRTPAFVGPRTLAFAISYSGGTEETLEMARGAFDAGARVVAVTAGGELAALAEERGGLHLPCTPDIPMPRLALCAMVAPVLVTLFRMGMLPEAHAGMTQAQRQLAHRRDQCKADVAAPANPARELARKIGRTIPVIHGAGGLGAVAAMRWKQSINENAKAPAFWNYLPELNHNEICGWSGAGSLGRLAAVFLGDADIHPRVRDRIELTEGLIREQGHATFVVRSRGQTRVERVFSLVLLGDLVSLYLAVLRGVDPTPVDVIESLKSRLAKR